MRYPTKRMAFLPVLMLTLLFLGGCSGGIFGSDKPPLVLSIRSEMTPLTAATPAGNDDRVFDYTRNTVGLFSAANETVSFQILLDAGDDGTSSVRVAFRDLVGPNGSRIEASHITAFRMMPVKVTQYPPWYLRLAQGTPQPVDFYDALIPVTAPNKGQPYVLAPKERLAIWVDVYAPRTTAAGVYKGELRVHSFSRRDTVLPLELKVYDFVLPDERPIAAAGGIDYRTLFSWMIQRDGKPYTPAGLDRNSPQMNQGLVLLRKLMVMSHEHRLDLFDRAMHPNLRRDLAGRLVLDWTDYDAVVTPYLNGSAFEDRVGCGAWPMPLSTDWPPPANYGGIDGPDYAATAVPLADQCRKHLAGELGFGGQLFVWPYRLGVSERAYAQTIAMAKLIRQGDPQTPILSQLPPLPPPLTGWPASPELAKLANISAPPAQWMTPPAAPQEAGKKLAGTWLAPGTPPYLPSLGVIATPADVRSIPWFAMKYNCSGLFLPEVLHWQGDIFNTPAEAETRLFYPGNVAGVESVLPSVRLKRLRRGLQDIAYLWLLRQRQRGDVATSITDSMVRYAGLDAAGDNYLDPRLNGWVHEGEVWEMARRLMAEEVQAILHPGQQSNNDLLAQRVAWREFENRTRTVRVEQVRTRVSPAQGGQTEIAVQLDLFNEYNRRVDVTAKLENLPEGYRAVAGEAKIAAMPPASRQSVTLTLRGPYYPPVANGEKPSLPVSLTVDMQQRRTVACTVPIVTAVAVKRAPVIDGRLDDWPVRGSNVAGNFRLLGARGQGANPMARRQTVAFVTRDDKNLYVAFRCEEPAMAELYCRASNILHYDQLMACGEDMVEILLDPGAKAKGPQDLYHIVVKPTGVLLTERGIHCDPPLGEASVWPVAASVAVAKEDKAWTVEVAIPLEALGAAAKEKIWGVNFMRFAPAGCEASSWSEAPRYFYDPRNLGTMILAEPQADKP